MTTQLSEHFSLAELTHTESRVIDNSPTLAIEDNLRWFAERLELVRQVAGVPITVTSCYRCPELNRSVGGSPTSDHLFGLAADMRGVGLSVTELFLRLYEARLDLKYRQIIHEFGRWVHVAYERPGSGQVAKSPDDQNLVIKVPGHYVRYAPGMEI